MIINNLLIFVLILTGIMLILFLFIMIKVMIRDLLKNSPDKIKVSFDYDYTLSKRPIQKLAKSYLKNNFEVWIVTSRLYESSDGIKYTNDDLFKTAKSLKIPKERIIFTNLENKYQFFEDKDFLINFDDDALEINLINKHTNTIGALL